MMLKSPELVRENFQCIKAIVAGSSPIGKSVIEGLMAKAGKTIVFHEVYGMTEFSPNTHFLNPVLHVGKIGSCGTLIPSTIAKVVDVEASINEVLCPPGKPGELWIKGPQVMLGYLNNEKATRETIDEDGWLHTGDLATYDEDGCFYIVNRIKELIKCNGLQVAPSEIENLLRQHPSVEDVAVIGVPDEQAGEVPRAYIVGRDVHLTEEDVFNLVKTNLAPFKQLKGGVQFVPFVPKAPSGKVNKRLLLEQYNQEVLRIR